MSTRDDLEKDNLSMNTRISTSSSLKRNVDIITIASDVDEDIREIDNLGQRVLAPPPKQLKTDIFTLPIKSAKDLSKSEVEAIMEYEKRVKKQYIFIQEGTDDAVLRFLLYCPDETDEIKLIMRTRCDFKICLRCKNLLSNSNGKGGSHLR
uniref:C3HC-type domain-containing protein n=1 Tax=Rhabditophanes sp. KR3021 TaxID=114890 RepID=A0AC35TI84_9BILA